MNQKDYKTSHQLAKELLAGPDRICVIAIPVFDMPGVSNAWPVEIQQVNVSGTDCLMLSPQTVESKPAISVSGSGKDYLADATERWGKHAEWISGDGRYALMANCVVLTVSLLATSDEAKKSKELIDQTGCCGGCQKQHKIIDLETNKEIE